jgi:nucleoside-diphosphate kinase
VQMIVPGQMKYPDNRRAASEARGEESGDDRQEGHDLDRHGSLRLHPVAPACPFIPVPVKRRHTKKVPLSPTRTEPAMARERTFSIIKPDATRRNLTGAINERIEKAGLRIVAQRRLKMSKKDAESFYAVHRDRPFFAGLVAFMTSGPVVVQVLEGENAVAKYREVMGATDPAKAAAGTIRKDFAESIEANSVHGSDSPENAVAEIAFFFKDHEIVG